MMKPSSVAFASLLVWMSVYWTVPAKAGVKGLDFERFKPAMDSQGLILTEGGRGEKILDFNVGFYLHYDYLPLVLTRHNANSSTVVVSERLGGNFVGSIGILEWLSIGLDVPGVFIQSKGSKLGTEGAGWYLANTARADMRLIPKFTLLDEANYPVSFSLIVPISLPTGDVNHMTGARDSTVTVSPTLAISRLLAGDRLQLAFNLGAWIRPGDKLDDFLAENGSVFTLENGNEMFLKLGMGLKLMERLMVIGELAGATKMDNPFYQEQLTPFEAVLAMRLFGPKDVVWTLGGATKIYKGWGTPDARVIFGMFLVPRFRDADDDLIADEDDGCPTQSGPMSNNGCPWGDKDADGLRDNVDTCPNQAGSANNNGCPWGDFDGDGITDNLDRCVDVQGLSQNAGCPIEDSDGDNLKDHEDKCPKLAGPIENEGCPWTDHDNDTIKDLDDRCPTEPGPAENQGCPWGDSDGDGIPDNLDRCPKEKEDIDGFDDTDGCLDLDNDKDGIEDKNDRCPNEPETVNGLDDFDGCADDSPPVVPLAEPAPEPVSKLVIIREEKIEIMEKVHFVSGKAKVLRDSFRILDEVANAFKSHPELQKVQIEGHTDSSGSDATNLRLSQKRANSVKEYLVQKGVEEDRIEAVGFGEAKPIAPNNTWRGREANRRVEFTIIKRSP